MNKKYNALAITKKVLGQGLIYIQLIIVAIIVIYPVLWVIGTAFNPVNSISRASIIPEGATLDNFRRLFDETRYASWYRNTLYVASLTMFFAVVLNTLTAFVFARFKFRGRKSGLLAVMILQAFPSFMGLIALYMIALNFGMLNNHNMLVIIYVGGSIPGSIWLVRGNMLNLPKSLDEAAYIDGASKLQVFTKIILPLSVPIISFIALTAFMAPWMDFILPRFLISRSEYLTLGVGLFDMINDHRVQFTTFSAGALLIAVPITLLFVVSQKFLISGIASGANKGE
ncbi:MAG: sugar ABC transporter permease [Defluviitaleaceae bacterium]|nr:sugar ABC transporter permease [Defluviitaleaceae bacterium]